MLPIKLARWRLGLRRHCATRFPTKMNAMPICSVRRRSQSQQPSELLINGETGGMVVSLAPICTELTETAYRNQGCAFTA
jgi:hypothetical protein